MQLKAWICVLLLLAGTTRFTGSALAGEPGPESPVVLPGAVQFDLTSIKGRTYRIFFAKPEGEVPERGLPVIYLSDANSNFPIMASLSRRRSRNGDGAVVVGIGYPSDDRQVQAERRTYDLTSPASEVWLKTQQGPLQGMKTGGNDEFLDFLDDEVKPLIEKRVKIDRSQQMLFGHSFGGLLVLHAAFTRPKSFSAYAASSASIWWNDRAILEEEKAFLAKTVGKELPVRLWLTVGERENPRGSDGANKMLEARRQGANATEMVERLSKAAITGLHVSYTELPGEDHGSAVLPAANRAVRQFLEVP